ncbi:pyrroloquinoline quinone biosynthesis peptide chaperone PqqD [Neptunomonas japonica]|uniref:PqqA binding protein n=1 Tax=Neptunomonas japonica JAMM 1380 TaxID=1441457 RepID=A0A7R6SUT4_9GAMM|nr:pyrroloquinoline quinone biosynthesis peptide chaperone PqqD [Neptunomonas japonica]BBB28020.1 pyrroloquinoline quinone biosynthesis protein D [Neptunomonas japonica JAMM 1380]
MMSMEMIPALESMFRFQWEEAQQCYVLLYPEGMVKLNGPAGEILSLVDGKRNLVDIIDLLVNKYPQAEDLDKDVVAFIDDALEQNWIRGVV